jgi:selenoprotein W-related protein
LKLRFTYCQECKNWIQALKDLEHIYPRFNESVESVEMVAGSNGVYDVHSDGRLIFSKDQENRFPEEAEVARRLAETAG